jgi:4-amino-4-deoxy-L-arabinose transferase-like glycosyltransferase
MLDAILSNPPSTPLYVILLRTWVPIAGHGDVAIRLPSVLLGTLTIPAAFWLARELDRRTGAGLLAAIFVAVSPYALEFAQEAAPYALAALLTTLALAEAWRWRRTNERRDMLLFVALGIGAVYSHYVAVAVLVLTALLGATRWSGTSRLHPGAWLGGFAVVLVAWLPWGIGLLLHWFDASAPRATLPSRATLEAVIGAAAQFGAGTAPLLAGARPLLGATLVLGGALLALGWRAGSDPARRGLRVVIGVSVVLFVAPAIVSAVTGAWLFVPHFMLLVLPALLAVMAAGAVDGSGLLSVARAGITAAWLAIAVVGCVWHLAEQPHGRDGLRELVAAIETGSSPSETGSSPSEPVLVTPQILEPTLAQYLDRPLTGIPEPFDLRDIYGPFVRPPTEADLAAATEVAAGDAPRVWLVHRPELDPGGIVPATLSERYTLAMTVPFEFGTLMRFEREPRGEP